MPFTVIFDPNQTSLQAQIIPNVSKNQDGLMPSSLYGLLIDSIADKDVALYVDSLNGSDTNNGSASSPFKTFDAAYAKAPALWYKSVEIILAAGPNDTQLEYPLTKGSYFVGLPVGADASRFKVRSPSVGAKNPDTGVLLGTMTIAASASPFSFTASVGLAPTSDGALKGALMQDLTNGASFTVSNNVTVAGVTTFTLSPFPFFGPSPGDEFTLSIPGAVLVPNESTGATFVAPSSSGITFDTVDVRGAADAPVFFAGGKFALNRTRHYNSSVVCQSGAQVLQESPAGVESIYLSGSDVNIGNNASFNPFGIIMDDGQVNCADGGFCFAVITDMRNSSYRFDSAAEGGLVFGFVDGSPTWGIEVNNGSTLSIYGSLDVSNSAADGIFVSDRAYCRTAGVTGSGNVGYGINVQAMSQAGIDLNGDLTSITGTIDDTLIGATAKTYGALRPDGFTETNAGGATLNRVGVVGAAN